VALENPVSHAITVEGSPNGVAKMFNGPQITLYPSLTATTKDTDSK